MASRTRISAPWSVARLVLVVLTTLGTSSCTAHFTKNVPATNIVMVDRAGWPIDPTGNVGCRKGHTLCQGDHNKARGYRRLSGLDYADYLENIFAALEARKPDAEGKRKILLYVHGGLNTQYTTIRRAYCSTLNVLPDADALDDRDDGYFPIYLNWQSNLVTSYFNTLYSVRKGRHRSAASPSTWGLTPFYFAQDAARAVTRAVPVWSSMVHSDYQGLRRTGPAAVKTEDVRDYQKAESQKAASGNGAAQAEDRGKKLDIHVSDGKDPGPGLWSGVSYVLTFPFKLLSSMVIDSAGTPAWSGMKRAAEAAFHSDELQCDRSEFKNGPRNCFHTEELQRKLTADLGTKPFDPGRVAQPTDGGFDLFLTYLKHHIQKHGGPEKYEVVLVGHSAGAIVVNEIIRQAEDVEEGKAVLPIKAIVYMAAATSIKDYEETVFPYLRRHPGTDIYHLTLNLQSEKRDHVGDLLDFPPRGSLLVWIDNFLNDRRTYRDRTAGRIDSLTESLGDLDAWQDIVDRIHIREFQTGKMAKATDPQRHGDFSDVSYWLPDCWKTIPDASSLCYRQASGQIGDRACSK